MLKKIVLLFTLSALTFSFFSPMVSAQEIGSISSYSAVLYEPESRRILYEKDPYTIRPMASTTKIMTALLAIENCPADKEIIVSPEAVRVEGSALGLQGGDRITMQDLVTGLMLESGNDAANVIAYAVSGSIPEFSKLMNRRAYEIGMKDTIFVTPSGLDKDNHSSTAYDMALLAAEALENEAIAAICASKHAVISFGNPPRKVSISNHNKLLNLYSYAIGMKTGFTKKSGRCLVSAAQKDGVKLIAVTLKGGDDWNDHISMYEYGFSQTECVELPIQKSPNVTVTGGTEGLVKTVMKTPSPCTMLKNEKNDLRVQISLPRFVIAPVFAGEVLGKVQYFAGDRLICMVDISAAYDIDERPVAGFWKRFLHSFSELFRKCVHL